MIRISIIFSIFFLFGCSSVNPKQEKAFLDSYDEELLYVRIVLPKDSRVPIDLGYPDVYHFKVIAWRKSSLFAKKKFHLFVNGNDLEIESGIVEVVDRGQTCELIIDVIPRKKEYTLINGTWEIKRCNG